MFGYARPVIVGPSDAPRTPKAHVADNTRTAWIVASAMSTANTAAAEVGLELVINQRIDDEVWHNRGDGTMTLTKAISTLLDPEICPTTIDWLVAEDTRRP